MLEKPNIPDELIISSLQEEYHLRVAELAFLPIGADFEDCSLSRHYRRWNSLLPEVKKKL